MSTYYLTAVDLHGLLNNTSRPPTLPEDLATEVPRYDDITAAFEALSRAGRTIVANSDFDAAQGAADIVTQVLSSIGIQTRPVNLKTDDATYRTIYFNGVPVGHVTIYGLHNPDSSRYPTDQAAVVAAVRTLVQHFD